MIDDPIVEETHAIRREIFAECGGDLERYIERLRAGDARHGERLVTLEELERRALLAAEQLPKEQSSPAS